MSGLIAATILGSLAYLVWSMRRFLRSIRDIIHINTAEGTFTSRLLPNLSFAALFFLLVYHSLLTESHLHLGLPANMNFVADFGAVTNLMDGGVLVHDMDSGKTEVLKPNQPSKMKALVTPGTE